MEIKISDIIVPEDRIRRVVEDDDFFALKDSINVNGQLTPITVYEARIKDLDLKLSSKLNLKELPKYTLVCGARRLAAIKKIGWKTIKANKLTITSKTNARICEIEENLKRKDFTWQERVIAIGDLYHQIQETEHAFNATKLADMLFVHKSTISLELDLYNNMVEFPAIMFCALRSQGTEKLRQLKIAKLEAEKVKRRISQAKEESKDGKLDEEYSKRSINRDNISASSISDSRATILLPDHLTIPAHKLLYPSAMDLLTSLSDHSVDLVITDPDWGNDIQAQKKVVHDENGKRVGIKNEGIYGYEYDGKNESFWKMITPCIAELVRVMKEGAHIYMFFMISNYDKLKTLFESAHFSVALVPLIWVQNIDGATSQPYFYPSGRYSGIFFAFAPGKRRRLIKYGQSNVLLYNAVPPKERLHPLETPWMVWDDLIKRSASKGDLVIDPFCGTGSSLKAALMNHCRTGGGETVEMYRNKAILQAQDVIDHQMKAIEDLAKKGIG